MFSCVTEQHSSALNSPFKANKEMYLKTDTKEKV